VSFFLGILTFKGSAFEFCPDHFKPIRNVGTKRPQKSSLSSPRSGNLLFNKGRLLKRIGGVETLRFQNPTLSVSQSDELIYRTKVLLTRFQSDRSLFRCALTIHPPECYDQQTQSAQASNPSR